MHIQQLFYISRPRFYSYLFGPVLIGAIIGISVPNQLTDPLLLSMLLFFTAPANLFLYGINDVFDMDTDAKNPKKGTYEHLLNSADKKQLLTLLFLLAGASVLFLLQYPTLPAWLMFAFFVLAICYSTPPIRFKSRPVLDSYSNILYALPGFASYSLFSGTFPSWQIVVIAWTFTAGLHTFSAIPDIIADLKAGVMTTANTLGKEKALLFVLGNWLLFCWFLFGLEPLLGIISLIYPILCIYLLISKQTVMHIYKKIPTLNFLYGLVTFWYIALQKFGLEAIWREFLLLFPH